MLGNKRYCEWLSLYFSALFIHSFQLSMGSQYKQQTGAATKANFVIFPFAQGLIFYLISSDVSRCVAERKYTQEQARKEFQQVFIPECNDDGTYSQVD